MFHLSSKHTFDVQDLQSREGEQYKSYRRMWHMTMKLKGEESGFEKTGNRCCPLKCEQRIQLW